MHLLKKFLSLHHWFVKNTSAVNFQGFRAKSALGCYHAKHFMQSCFQISYSPLYLRPAGLKYFQPMFHIWRNPLADLYQRNLQKHMWKSCILKLCKSLTWTWNITFLWVFFTQLVSVKQLLVSPKSKYWLQIG